MVHLFNHVHVYSLLHQYIYIYIYTDSKLRGVYDGGKGSYEQEEQAGCCLHG